MKPIINLDDRRFDDLVEEAKARLLHSLPELTQIVPGDPVHALVDVFAWLTETILYRANLIPERQRQAFLNLLQIPRRPAVPARGLICVDSTRKRTAHLPAIIAAESHLPYATQHFSSVGDLQPTPLLMDIVCKERISDQQLLAMGITPEQLRHTSPAGNASLAFRPRHLLPGRDPLSLAATVDQALYLGFSLPLPLVAQKAEIVKHLAGITLNIGIAPADDALAEQESQPLPRQLKWELAWQQDDGLDFDYLPLEQLADSSNGARTLGVIRLRLPKEVSLLQPHLPDDPANAGMRNSPPEQPGSTKPEQMLFWLRLRCPEQPDLQLAYLAVNAVEVIGQGVARDVMLGLASGQPDQLLTFPQQDIDPDTLQIDVEESGQYVAWQRVEHFGAASADDRVYVLDAAEGWLRFGDGYRGKLPARGKRIRAAHYRYGGGAAGNLPANSLKVLENAAVGLQVRQDWPTAGGIDAESVSQMEQRIAGFLSHRNRAVTRDDFTRLALDNPINPVAKAELISGFLPGSSLATARFNVPGVISVFVLPPAELAMAAFPRTRAGLLRDVYGYLSERCLLGTELYVLSPEYVAVAISIAVQEQDPQTRQQVYHAVENSLLQFLWPLSPGGRLGQGWLLGQAVDVNELRTIAGRVAGVQSIGDVQLFVQGSDKQWQTLNEGQSLTLQVWQLPELQAISVQPLAKGEALIPPNLVSGQAEWEAIIEWIPIPIIPDMC
ncbi:MAG: putative baseplate assembly protein [Methylomonas sp.]|nr:MAG: putative baseplate assembly protein [Methylomonas sp.]